MPKKKSSAVIEIEQREKERKRDLEDKRKELFESIKPISVITIQEKNPFLLEGVKSSESRFLVGNEKIGDSWPAIKLTPTNVRKIFAGQKTKVTQLTVKDMIKPFNCGVYDNFNKKVLQPLKKEFRKLKKQA